MRWIKCSEQLPELIDDLCLVYSKEGGDQYGFPAGGYDCVHVQDYFGDVTCGLDGDGKQLYTQLYISKGITHWMPYPKAPVE